MGSDVVVYTAVFGGRDTFRPPQNLPYDFRIFTDSPEIADKDDRAIYVPLLVPRDHIRSARLVKVMSHVFLPGYKTWIWQDSSFDIKPEADLAELIFRAGELGVWKHTQRSCIYEEARACIDLGKDNEDVIKAQMQKYMSYYQHPPGAGLGETGLLVRQNTPRIRRFNAEWWKEIALHSCRDQLSFNVIARRFNLEVNYLGNLRENPWLVYVGHRR